MRKFDINKHTDAKAFSIEAAFCCLRYALGGKSDYLTIEECILWLQCMKGASRNRK